MFRLETLFQQNDDVSFPPRFKFASYRSVGMMEALSENDDNKFFNLILDSQLYILKTNLAAKFFLQVFLADLMG